MLNIKVDYLFLCCSDYPIMVCGDIAGNASDPITIDVSDKGYTHAFTVYTPLINLIFHS